MAKSRRQDMARNHDEDISRLKDANKKLRADNRSLRKELKKALEYVESVRDLIDDEETIEVLPVKKTEKQVDKCPKCGHNIVEIPAGMYLIRRCSGCTWRKKYEA